MEVIVAIGILSVGGSAVIIMILGSLRGADLGGQQTIASAYARQGWEAVKSVGKSGYNRLATGTYSLTETGNVWGLAPGSDTNGIYARTVAVADVNRDGSGDIVTIGGTKDIGTRKVTTTVSWPHAAGVRTYETVDYFTYWDSSRFFEDVVVDFSDGTFSNTETSTVADPDGSVRLAALPPSAWACFERDGVLDPTGSTDGLSVAISGTTAYVGLLAYAAGPEFLVVDITNPNVPTITGSLELGASVFGVAVSGTTVFLATSDNAAELRAVSVAVPAAPASVGVLDLSGNTDALALAVTGSRAYVTRATAAGADFYTINVGTPASMSLLGSVDLGGSGAAVKVSGTNAFVATTFDTGEFRVVNITTDATPTISATIDLPSVTDATGLDLFGTKAYVVTAVNGAGSEFYVINIATPSSPVTQGSLDLAIGATAIAMDGTSAMIATSGSTTASILYVDAVAPTAPVLASSQRLVSGNIMALAWNGSSTLVAPTVVDTAELLVVNRQTTTDWGCGAKKGTFNTAAAPTAVFVSGTTAYVVTATATGPEFYVLNVSVPTAPSLVGSVELGATANDVVVSGNFAYIAGTGNAAELQVVNITTPSAPVVVGTLNLAGNTDATAIGITGTKVVLAQGATFFNINVATPATPVSLGSVALAGVGNKIAVLSSSVAYVATAGDAAEVQVMNITANTPSVTTSFNAAGTADGTGLWIKGSTTLYLSTLVNASGGEFYTLNISTPTSPSLTGTLEVGLSGTAVAADDNELFAFEGVSTANRALIAVNTAVPSTPAIDAFVPDIGFTIIDVFFANDTLYALQSDTANDFVIFGKTAQGGSSGGFQTNGTYISSIMDAGQTANWNTVTWTPDVACVGSSLQVQVRTATTSGGLAGEMWQGPDGEDADETDFFTDAAGHLIHTDHNGDQFIQYRATFAGPGTCASEMYDIEITGTVF